MPDQAYETLLTETDASVVTITLNRPDALNALNSTMRRVACGVQGSRSRRRGPGRGYDGSRPGLLLGADLRGGGGERQFRRVLTTEYNPLIEAIRGLPSPWSQRSMGSPPAPASAWRSPPTSWLRRTTRGSCLPSGASGWFPTPARSARSSERWTPSGVRDPSRERQLGADDAHAAGLVAALVPGDRLADTTRELACGWRSGPGGIALTKRLMNAAEDASLADGLAAEAALQELAGRTEDHAEGVAAFDEKRDPAFRGR